MNEIGFSVVPNPPKAKARCYVPNFSGWQIRDADVDGLPRHMEALLGHTAALFAQGLVGLFRPVSRDHFNGASAPTGQLNLVQDIQKTGINGVDISCPEIPEERVERLPD